MNALSNLIFMFASKHLCRFVETRDGVAVMKAIVKIIKSLKKWQISYWVYREKLQMVLERQFHILVEGMTSMKV